MKARKQLSLEELFRLYPQLRLVTHQDVAREQDTTEGNAMDAPATQAGELAEA